MTRTPLGHAVLNDPVALGDTGARYRVEVFGFIFACHDYGDRPFADWTLPTRQVFAVNQALEHGHADLLDLEPRGLTDPSRVGLGQPYLFGDPLRHYLAGGRGLYDAAQPGNQQAPVVLSAEGRWVVVNGCHRYAAAVLAGRLPVPVLAVAAPAQRWEQWATADAAHAKYGTLLSTGCAQEAPGRRR